MSYVIYRQSDTKLMSKEYKTHAAAEAALTRMNKKWAVEHGMLGNEPTAPTFTMGIACVDYYYETIQRLPLDGVTWNVRAAA